MNDLDLQELGSKLIAIKTRNKNLEFNNKAAVESILSWQKNLCNELENFNEGDPFYNELHLISKYDWNLDDFNSLVINRDTVEKLINEIYNFLELKLKEANSL